MGQIFLARVGDVGASPFELVLKRVRPELQVDQNVVKMFYDEALIASRMEHPHIIRLFEMGKLDGSLFISMELVEGVNLGELISTLIAQKRALPIDLGLMLGRAILSALEYAHTFRDRSGRPLRIVHRDVSPPNVLLDFSGGVKLLDFGIIKAEGKLHKTLPGMVKGRLAYMAPEQVRADPVDARTDVFAAGAVLFELLLLRHPFFGRTDPEIINAIMTQPCEDALRIDPDFPPKLKQILERALNKSPDERFQSAGHMDQELASLMRLRGVKPDPARLRGFLHEVYRERISRQVEARRRHDDGALLSAFQIGSARRDLASAERCPPRLEPKGPVPGQLMLPEPSSQRVEPNARPAAPERPKSDVQRRAEHLKGRRMPLLGPGPGYAEPPSGPTGPMGVQSMDVLPPAPRVDSHPYSPVNPLTPALPGPGTPGTPTTPRKDLSFRVEEDRPIAIPKTSSAHSPPIVDMATMDLATERHQAEPPRPRTDSRSKPPKPSNGFKLGGYVLLQRMQVGRIEEIYRARLEGPMGFEKRLALRRLAPERSGDSTLTEPFVRQAMLTSTWSHPNLLQLFDFGIDGGEHYAVTELVDGWNLAKVLQRVRSRGVELPVEIACRIVAEVGVGLHYMHSQAFVEGRACTIIHRNVCPKSVLLSSQGAVKLSGMGFARELGRQTKSYPANMREQLEYLAPEVMNPGAGPLGVQADVYSLGVLLAECLTKDPLFSGTEKPAIERAVLEDPSSALLKLSEDYYSRIASLVGRSVAPKVNDRLESVREFLRALDLLMVDLRRPMSAVVLADWLRELFPEASPAF